jgi:hypothetical protein
MKSVLYLLFLFAAVSTGATPALADPILIDPAVQARLQIVTKPLEAVHTTTGASAPGFARVLDPSPLLALIGDTDAATATAEASAAEAARTAALAKDSTVSAKTNEAAQAQARTDAAHLTQLKQRLALEWGPSFAALPAPALHQLGADLAAARAAIVRIDAPAGAGIKGASQASLDFGALGQVQAKILGVARTADQKLQSPGLIAIVTGPDAAYLSTGLTATTQLSSGGDGDGVLVPNDALLRQDGQVVAFVKTGVKGFDKRVVHPAHLTAQGIVVTSGFRAGERVVVQGAQALSAASAPKADGDD